MTVIVTERRLIVLALLLLLAWVVPTVWHGLSTGWDWIDAVTLPLMGLCALMVAGCLRHTPRHRRGACRRCR